jgi:hypothetical protein
LYYKSFGGLEMPDNITNVIIIGFNDLEVKELIVKISDLLLPIVANPKEIVCTPIKTDIYSTFVHTDVLDGNGKVSPYIILRSTSDNLMKAAARLESLGIDMQVEMPLLKFIPGKK